MVKKRRIVVIGGGFFGLYIAEHFAKTGASVRLFERSSECMQRASYVNQARVHNGYHYPRSVLTALRSRVSFPRFCSEFPDCINGSFEKYYMVGNILGKVTANQFRRFCERIGASCEPAPNRITKLVNPRLVEAVFSARELAFDAVKLKTCMLERVAAAGVQITTSANVNSVTEEGNELRVDVALEDGVTQTIAADQVFNCTYAMLNSLSVPQTVEPIPLKHELTELCLVEVPEELRNVGITVMCGPFFSVMPFPSAGLHSFSHVRYTPHAEWHESQVGANHESAYQVFERSLKNSAWNKIRYDAQRYMPVLGESRYRRSIWEVKTVLPKSEKDDSRPILFKPNHGMRGYHCIMGGKIDNVYDAIDVIQQLHLDQ